MVRHNRSELVRLLNQSSSAEILLQCSRTPRRIFTQADRPTPHQPQQGKVESIEGPGGDVGLVGAEGEGDGGRAHPP